LVDIMLFFSGLFAAVSLVVLGIYIILCAILVVPLLIVGLILFGLFIMFTHVETHGRGWVIKNDVGSRRQHVRSTVSNPPSTSRNGNILQ